MKEGTKKKENTTQEKAKEGVETNKREKAKEEGARGTKIVHSMRSVGPVVSAVVDSTVVERA